MLETETQQFHHEQALDSREEKLPFDREWTAVCLELLYILLDSGAVRLVVTTVVIQSLQCDHVL